MLPSALIALAYLIGSIPFSFLVVRLVAGKDVRDHGSGNVGATNVARTAGKVAGIVALLLCLGGLSALTYGSVAALLAEMFPPQIRYSSMSIPYHIGAGYLGGFLPLISGIIVARTGDVYAGLWYTWAVVAFGVVVAWWGIPDGPPRDFQDDA